MYQWHFTLTGDSPKERLRQRNLPPILLLHGWMGSCEDYADIVDLLSSRFDCIAVDLPGHGKTEVIGGELGYDFVNTARGLIQLLDSLEIDRCSITGYSFGGRLALYLALEFPDRFDRVLLESTSPGLATASDRQARIIHDRQIIDQLETTLFADFVNDWYRQSLFFGIDKHPNFPALIHRRIGQNRASNLAKSLQYAGLGMQPYLGDRLKLHTKPISLLVGALDRKFVNIGRDLERMCATIDLRIIPKCSHNIHFEQPELWIEQIVER